jgi:AraC-like DNA-binding protein
MVSACTKALSCTDSDLRALFEGTGIDPDQLAEPNRTLTQDQEIHFYKNLIRIYPEPGLGLRLGKCIRMEELGPLGYALLTGKNLMNVITVSREYMDLLVPYFRWDLVVTPTEAIHRFSRKGGIPREVSHFLLELVMSMTASHGRVHLGKSFNPTRVGLNYADPGYAHLYRDCFGAPISFNQPANEIRYPREYLKVSLKRSDPLINETMKSLCDTLVARLEAEANVVEDVVSILTAAMDKVPSQEDVAKGLFISSRTLRRQLSEHGLTFRKLLNRVRMDRAKNALMDPDAHIRDVAEQCGFSELSSFNNAFNRWTGVSPAVWRQDHSGCSQADKM